jgi:hypothetical protein
MLGQGTTLTTPALLGMAVTLIHGGDLPSAHAILSRMQAEPGLAPAAVHAATVLAAECVGAAAGAAEAPRAARRMLPAAESDTEAWLHARYQAASACGASQAETGLPALTVAVHR